MKLIAQPKVQAAQLSSEHGEGEDESVYSVSGDLKVSEHEEGMGMAVRIARVIALEELHAQYLEEQVIWADQVHLKALLLPSQ